MACRVPVKGGGGKLLEAIVQRLAGVSNKLLNFAAASPGGVLDGSVMRGINI